MVKNLLKVERGALILKNKRKYVTDTMKSIVDIIILLERV